MIKNKVGLEFEFLLRGKKDDLIFPGKHGFETDDFIILGEARAEPGNSPDECLGNFYKEYYKVLKRAEEKGFKLDLTGFAEISNALNATILKAMGTKTIAETKNIYGTEILEREDSVIKDGKVVGKFISTGLHIHFSSFVEKNLTCTVDIPVYEPVIILNGTMPPFDIFKKADKMHPSTETISNSVSRITMPVVKEIVTFFDKNVLKNYLKDFPADLKYRLPGFYEIKSHGFEYRSLPFNEAILSDIHKIVFTAFEKLDELKLK